jgi:methyltransferase (TIGR00027 family)
MKSGRPSTTAAIVAAARGMGAFLPDAAHIADDPYGLQFAGRAASLLARVGTRRPWWVRALLRPNGRLEFGVLWLQLRTRALDDIVRQFVAKGGRQVLLLGAGYDTRATRLAQLASDLLFFEVDHPATQAHKRAVLARNRVSSEHARYVAWDFEARSLAQLPAALAECGHCASSATLTIWEGVTMYLSEPAIDSSVRSVRALSAAGSQFAITYFERSSLQRERLTHNFVAGVGEPLRFGWDAGELRPYLEARGFQLIGDETAPQLARRLFPQPYASRGFRAFRHIALAEVVGSQSTQSTS